MAGDRNVKLGVQVETTGAQALRALAADVNKLATEGGQAAPEFQRLAAEIDKLANQADGIAAVQALRSEIDKLGAEQGEAATRAREAATEQDRLRKAWDDSKGSVRDSQDSLRKYQSEVQRAKEQIDLLKASTLKSETQNQGYRAELLRLVQAHQAAKEAVRSAKEELAASQKSANDARDAYRAYGKEITAANGALSSATGEVARRTADLDKLTDALRKAGVETTDLAAAQDKVRASFGAAYDALNKQQAAVVRTAEEQERLARISKVVAEDNLRNVRLAQAAADRRTLAEQQAAAAAEESARRQETAARRAFDNIERQARQAADAQRQIKVAAEAAAKALDDSFAKTGVRAANAIEKEIREIDQSLVRLASNARVSGQEFSRAFASGQARIAELRKELTGVPSELERTGSAVGFVRGQIAQLAALYSGVELARKFFEANVEVQSLQRSLTATTGSSEAAQKQIEFLQRTANNAGLSIGGLSEDFLRFNAAARGAGKDSAFINETFDLVANASGRLGISTQRTGLIFNALTQILSKGKPTLEEIQGQLGESLPGALSILSKGLGLTTEEFLKLIKQGELTSDEVFGGLRRGLASVVNEGQRVEGLAASWNRFKNALTQVAQTASDSSALKGLSTTLDFLAVNINKVVDGSVALAKAVVVVKVLDYARGLLGLKAAANEAAIAQERATLATRAGTTATAENTAATAANTTAATANAAAKSRSLTVVNQAALTAETAAIVANTTARAANTAAAAGNAAAWAGLAAGLAKIDPPAKQSTQAVGGLSAVVASASNGFRTLLGFVGGLPGAFLIAALNAKALGEGIAGLLAKVTGLTKAEKELEEQLKREEEGYKRNAAAQQERQAAADAAQRAITKEIRQQVEAAETQVKATEKLVEARKLEGDAARSIIELSGNEQAARAQAAFSASSYAQALATSATARADEVRLLREQVVQMEEAARRTGGMTLARQEEITKLKEEIVVKEAASEKARQAAAAANVEAAGLKLVALAYEDNSSRLAEYREAVDNTRASLEAARALQQQGLATQELVNKAALAAAEAEGKYRDAIADTTENIRRRIELNAANGGLRNSQIALQIQEYKNEEAIATAYGQSALALYNKVRQKELEAKQVRESAALKANEAKLELEAAQREREELERLGQLTPQKAQELRLREINAKQKAIEAETGKRVADGLDRETEALRLNNAVKVEAINLTQSLIERNRQLADESAAQDAARNSRNAQAGAALGGDVFFDLAAKKRDGRLSANDLSDAEAAYRNFRNNLDTVQRSPAGSFSLEAIQSARAQFNQARAILEAVQALAATVGGAQSAGTTVNIDLGGRRTTLQVASGVDANALVDLLRELQSDSARAGGGG